MTDASDDKRKRRKPLVSVEFQREVDVATGEGETRMFVKLYFEARDSGLIRALGPHRWQTLSCLATYMNANGRCNPGQDRLGRDLGISRQKLNKRIQDLLNFRFEGRPVVTLARQRTLTKRGGRWATNEYSVLPISSFSIFNSPRESTAQLPEPIETTRKAPMSPKGDIGPMSRRRDTRKGDTNKNQYINKTHGDRVISPIKKTDIDALITAFNTACGHATGRKPLPKERQQARELLHKHGNEKALHVIQYGVDRCRETFTSSPEVLGGILPHVDAALENFEQKREGRLAREKYTKQVDREDAEREAKEAAIRVLPFKERVAHRLETRIQHFRIGHRRSPTADELEKMRLKIEQQERQAS